MKLREFLLNRFSQEELDSDVTLSSSAPIDCVLGETVWVNSGDPITKADGSVWQPQTGTRPILVEPANGGAPCGPTTLEREVLIQAAPVPEGQIQIKELNRSAMLCFREYYGLARYSRGQSLTIIKATDSQDPQIIDRDRKSQVLKFGIVSQTGGGVAVGFPVSEYQLLVDGEALLTQTVEVGGTIAEFNLGPIVNDLSHGWHELDIRPETGAVSVPMVVYVSKFDGPHEEEYTRVMTGTHALSAGRPFAIAKVRAVIDPPDYSLTPVECEHFSEPISRGQLFREMIVPMRSGHIYRPNVSDEGIPSTANWQAYHWAHFLGDMPDLPLLDGPRGLGNLYFVTHLMPGRNGDCYFADPWRIGIVFLNGTVKTFSGWVDDIPPRAHNARDRKLSLRGIWETEGPHRYSELWSLFWQHSSIQIDENAPMILNDRTGVMEHPHPTNPVLFACDSKHNRVLKHIFPRDHHGEPTVQDFAINLQDPWGGFEKNGIVYVAERKASRVSMWDANMGAYLGNLIEATPEQAEWAYVSSGDRKAKLRVSLEQARTAPILLPEGMDCVDDWAYIASTAQNQVIRVNLVTGERQVCFTGMRGNYLQIAVSKDDSFGPKHTIWASNWGAGNFGMPSVRLLQFDETTGFSHSGKWDYNAWTGAGNVVRGRGGNWGGADYTSAVGVGQGRLYCGFSNEGLAMIRKAKDSEEWFNTARYRAGAEIYKAKGYKLIHGDYGYGYDRSVPLPWGENEDLDYYLECCGHVRP